MRAGAFFGLALAGATALLGGVAAGPARAADPAVEPRPLDVRVQRVTVTKKRVVRKRVAIRRATVVRRVAAPALAHYLPSVSIVGVDWRKRATVVATTTVVVRARY
ncbi:MAG TPA: hypothetical protein VIL72_10950 [Beijerinckiaceae bacterium]|jgi:hypothetical protein